MKEHFKEKQIFENKVWSYDVLLMSIKKAVRDDIPWVSLMGWFDKNIELKKLINF
jgi:hypothetical protein